MLKQSKIIAVSLTPSLVKIAQVTSAGLVEKIVQKAVSAGAMDAALRDAVSGIPLKGMGVVCVLPGDVATTKSLEVPSVNREEIESILTLQASRHTPFNKDEILTSYIKIGNPRPNFSKVLLVVVKRDAVKERLAAMRAAGLDTGAVLFAPESVARFYAKALSSKKGEKIALLDVGMQNTNFIIMADGIPLMARNIPAGIEAVACDPAVLAQITAETKTSIDAFEQENADRPFRLMLTTDHMVLAGLDASLADALAIKVETVAYPSLIKGVKGVKEQLLKEFADEPALDIIAAAAMVSKCGADLVPQEVRDQRSIVEKGRETMKAGIFLLLTLTFVGAGLLSRVYFKDLFLKQNLIERYAEEKKEVGLLENMINKTRIMRSYLEARSLPLEAIRELYRIVPEEMYLSSISMDDTGNVTLQGVSESMSRVFSVVTELEDSPLFENVKTKSTMAKKDRGKDAAAFEITLKLSETQGHSSAGTVSGADALKQGK